MDTVSATPFVSMHRRQFLGRAAALAAIPLLPQLLRAADPAPAPTPVPAPSPAPAPQFTPLRRNVGFFTARGGTIGWLVNDAGIAVVDTQFADTAALFLSGLPGRSGRRIDVVLNTHHHGDHTGGNATFRPQTATIVAHQNVPELMKAAAERNKQPLVAESIPDVTYPETWRREIGDEVVSTRYLGPAHTRGDVIVHFEKANVVHMGDLMFNRLYPVIDRPGGAKIKSWIALLERVHREYPADASYIFGHGSPRFGVNGKREDLLSLRDYLSALLEHTGREISAGKTKEQIAALENFPGFPDFHQPLPNRLGLNLSVAYDELTAG